MGMTQRQMFWILVFAVLSADILTLVIFLLSRNDPTLRIAALMLTSNVAIAYVAIASTLLTGKDLTGRKSADDLPPNTTQTTVDQIKTGPL